MVELSTERKWRKILYEDQEVPDNYVDSTFLVEMRKNLYVRQYDSKCVVYEAGSLQQQLCSILAFVLIYSYMLLNILSPYFMQTLLLVLVSLGAILNWTLRSKAERSLQRFMNELRTGALLFILTLGLTPVLHTLTSTISTDTLYFMTFCLLTTCWITYQYEDSQDITSNALSINSGVLAAICLGSRLPSHWHTFTIVCWSLVLFSLWPFLRRRLKNICYPGVQLGMTFGLSILSFIGLLGLSGLMAILFVIGSVGINFIGPAILIRMQGLKNNIHGPWDEAMINQS